MLALGLDVGGTHVGVGVVDQQGKIIARAEMATRSDRPQSEVLDEIAKTALAAAEQAGGLAAMRGIGVGLPGVVEVDRGVLVFADNLGWHNVDIRHELQARLGDIPVYAGNDANVAALAEARAGACKGADSAVLLTLGTGLGGGIIIGGDIHTGAHFVGGEVGHMIVEVDGRQCNCGTLGCWERYASATALVLAGRAAMAEAANGAIAKAAGGDPEKVNARIVVDAAKAGDPAALAIWQEYIKYLVVGMVSLTNLLDPQVFVIGGGVSAAGEFLREATQTLLHKMLSFRDSNKPDVKLATLGNDAGIIGAAMLAHGK